MKIKSLIIFVLLTLSTHAWAWRIEGEILHLEKGDNIWQVAYCLTGDGKNWRELWDTRIDTLITNPFHSYPNMEFKLKSELFSWENSKRVNTGILNTSFQERNKEGIAKSENVSQSESSKILGMDYNFARIMIPVLVTLLVFLLGQFIGWLKGKYERKNELDSIKVTIHNWLIMIEPSIQQQITGCNNFVLALQSSTNIHPERFQFSPMLVDKLQQIELKQLIETMVVNLEGEEETKAKMIFNFVSQVEFLAKMETHIRENYEKFHSYTFELMEDWNKTFKKFNLEMNETSKQIHLIDPGNQFVTRKNQICNTFLQHREIQPLNTIFVELITPLENEVLQFLQTSPNKELATNFGYTIEDLKIIKSKWDMHKQGHMQLATDFATKINTVYNVLKNVSEHLRNSEFKNVMKIK